MTENRARIRWGRTLASGFGLLLVALSVQAWSRHFSHEFMTDYLSYWAAGKLTLAGDPAGAYDVAKHRAVEFSVTEFKGLNPFPYPPPFLLLVAPFSLLPYMWGFAAWVVVTFAAYLLLTRRAIETPYALAHPPVLMNGLIGQNGFLTAGLFTAGTAMLRERPFLAGAILGCLVIKPQLALLLPVAVIAARLWPAIAGALATAGVLGLVSLALFGASAFIGFWNILPLYTELMRQDKWPWNEFISVFAFLRYFGVDQTVALSVHAVVAAAAVALTWIAWSRNWKNQVPILAAATLLVPPYLLTYDALLMIIPMGFWLKDRERARLVGLLWLLCFLPIAFYFNLYRGPNTVPLAALLFLGVCVADRLRGGRKGLVAADVDHAHLV
ncbi:glycosyltransferase family 87 protein [Sphingomonas daechungensis]|uniref:glycosyltransferase family 87 protein n=1 Tax=Sphingomonas daechungensis TaxID=1176646 RepID=UPI0031EE7F53